MSSDAAWVTLAVLGVYHGINPAMGWLFAVSRGMQERSRRAVLRSLVPIAIGHEASIALVALLVLTLSTTTDPTELRYGAAAALVAFGIFRFVKPRAHFRWTSMRVSDRELGVWSFLMSTAHGAGLMIAPVILGLRASHNHDDMAMLSGGPIDIAAVGIAVHVLAMLIVMGAIAFFVYERVGLQILRRAWLNTDQVWAGAFIVAGLVTLTS
ncbi:MAG TPA: hypothetical protein VH834_16075 [Solirubrobacteraceae bacterium]